MKYNVFFKCKVYIRDPNNEEMFIGVDCIDNCEIDTVMITMRIITDCGQVLYVPVSNIASWIRTQ